MGKKLEEKTAETAEQLTDEKEAQRVEAAAEDEAKARADKAEQESADSKVPSTKEPVESPEGVDEVIEAEKEATDDDLAVPEKPEQVTGTASELGSEEIDQDDREQAEPAAELEDQEVEPANADAGDDQTEAPDNELKAEEPDSSIGDQPEIAEAGKTPQIEAATEEPDDRPQATDTQAVASPEIKQADDDGLIEADAAFDNQIVQPGDERLGGVNPDEIAAGADQLTGADQMGADGLDVFGDLGPVAGGGVPGDEFDLPGLDGFGGGDDAGDGFDAFGSLDPQGSGAPDLGSIGLGGDPRTGWDGQNPNNDGDAGGQNDGWGGSQQSGTDSGTNYGNPTGASRENPADFGGSSGSTGGSGDTGGSGSWTGITDWSDTSDSNGNQQIDGYEEYHQEDGTTLIVETHHDDEGGTTQKVTLYDEDGNVIESEETHEPAGDSNGGGGNEGSGNGESGSEGGSDSDGGDSSTGDTEGGSDDGGSTDASGGTGDDSDSRPNPYADDYNTDVDISLTFSNEELTTPVEPGGTDTSFGSERLIAFGNGIVDPRTVNPAPDDTGADTGGDGAGDGLVGEGIVDPVGPGFFTGSSGFASGLISADGDGLGIAGEDDFDDFDMF